MVISNGNLDLAKHFATSHLEQGPHAFLLSGPQNSGVFEHCVQQIQIADNSGDIVPFKKPKIKELRELQTILYQKNSEYNKWVIIDDITSMSIPAQNSLLKVIEEPVNGLCFVLISYNDLQLLDTIVSRCHRINCQTILDPDTCPLLGNQFEPSDVQLRTIIDEINQKNWREAVVRLLWDKKDMTQEDLTWIIDKMHNKLNLSYHEFLDLQKILKNILHTGSVKLNLYNMALIGQPKTNSSL